MDYLRDIWYVLWNYRSYRADEEYAALEIARLEEIAKTRFCLDFWDGQRWLAFSDFDAQSAYLVCRYGGSLGYEHRENLIVESPTVLRMRFVYEPHRGACDVSRETVNTYG